MTSAAKHLTGTIATTTLLLKIINSVQEEYVAFLLTNSLDWSFGMAKKNRDKVKVESVTHYNISTAGVNAVDNFTDYIN